MNTNNQTSRDGGGGGGIDDCWNVKDTYLLINSWGDRYLQNNRKFLGEYAWIGITDTFNSHRDKSLPPKTVEQCKKQIDTLRKKFRNQQKRKSKSSWRFYYPLQCIIDFGENKLRKRSRRSSSRNNGNDNDNLEEFGEKTSACVKLAKSIVKFGKVYARSEKLKQDEMMKLEKQRIAFAKEVEFQRLDMFMETKLEIEKMKMMIMKTMKKKKKKTMISTSDSLISGITLLLFQIRFDL